MMEELMRYVPDRYTSIIDSIDSYRRKADAEHDRPYRVYVVLLKPGNIFKSTNSVRAEADSVNDLSKLFRSGSIERGV